MQRCSIRAIFPWRDRGAEPIRRTASLGPMRTLQLQFGSLPDDTYTLTLLSGAGQFQDLVGNILDGEPHSPFALPSGDGHAGGNFVVHFTADITSTPFPTPLSPKDPLGSLIYDGSTQAIIATGSDTDSFTIVLDAGQTLTAVVIPASGLRPTFRVLRPRGFQRGAGHGGSSRQTSRTTDCSRSCGGNLYDYGRFGAAGRPGHYSLQLILNAAVEDESHNGLSNNTQPGQNIDGSFISLTADAQRAALLGSSDGSTGYLPNEVEPNNSPAVANDARENFNAVLRRTSIKWGLPQASPRRQFGLVSGRKP